MKTSADIQKPNGTEGPGSRAEATSPEVGPKGKRSGGTRAKHQGPQTRGLQGTGSGRGDRTRREATQGMFPGTGNLLHKERPLPNTQHATAPPPPPRDTQNSKSRNKEKTRKVSREEKTGPQRFGRNHDIDLLRQDRKLEKRRKGTLKTISSLEFIPSSTITRRTRQRRDCHRHVLEELTPHDSFLGKGWRDGEEVRSRGTRAQPRGGGGAWRDAEKSRERRPRPRPGEQRPAWFGGQNAPGDRNEDERSHRGTASCPAPRPSPGCARVSAGHRRTVVGIFFVWGFGIGLDVNHHPRPIARHALLQEPRGVCHVDAFRRTCYLSARSPLALVLLTASQLSWEGRLPASLWERPRVGRGGRSRSLAAGTARDPGHTRTYVGRVTRSLMIGLKMVKHSPQRTGCDAAQRTAQVTAGTQTQESRRLSEQGLPGPGCRS